jgi:signal transduction histidine kinase/CheY-like chemotaxis protein
MSWWTRFSNPDRRRSLLARAAAGNIALQTAAAAVVVLILLLSTSRVIQDQMSLRASSWASFLAARARFDLLVGDRQALTELARTAVRDRDAVFVSIEDLTGAIRIRVFAEGFAGLDPGRQVPGKPVLRKRPVRYIEAASFVPQPAGQALYGIEQEAAGGKPLGVVRVGLSMARYDEFRARVAWMSSFTALLAIGAVVWVQHLNLKRLLKPLRELIAFTRTVSQGDLSKTAPVRRRDEAGDLAVAFNEMVEGLRSRQELTLRMREVETSQRLRNEFLANMSHEIRTPMNGIIGLTDLVLETDLSDEQRDYLATVRTSAGSLLTVLNDILDFSKVDAGKLELHPEPFDLWETVCHSARTLSVAAHRAGLEIVCDVADTIPRTLVGDAIRLRQVLLNLLGNAVKFTRQGQILVKVEPAGRANRQALLRFAVSDTGIGIPQDRLAHIFEPFTQVDSSSTRSYGGTGLGLAISAQVVKLLGGEIGVTSEVERGSTFHFTARFEVPDQPAGAPPSPPTAVELFVVDDNAETRRVLRRLLERHNVAVAEFASVDACERALAAEPRGKRVALVDGDLLAAPAAGGAEQPGLLEVFSIKPGVDLPAAAQAAIRLQKPVEPNELRRAVCAALGTALCHMEKRTPQLAPPPVSGLRILLAEDNLVNQKLARRLLERWGNSVTPVVNGREALDALARRPFDLVLMDVQMPELDGLAATAELRRREGTDGPRTPVLIVTAHAMSGSREQCLAAGADGYVSKPIDARELAAAIEQVAGVTPPSALHPPEPLPR